MMRKYLSPSTAPSPEILTRKEYKVLQLIVTGKRSSDIAIDMSISKRTVEVFRAHISKKLMLRTPAELVIYSIRYGIIDADGKPTSRLWASF